MQMASSPGDFAHGELSVPLLEMLVHSLPVYRQTFLSASVCLALHEDEQLRTVMGMTCRHVTYQRVPNQVTSQTTLVSEIAAG